MKPESPGGIGTHDSFAAEYDRQVQEYACYLQDALFGLVYEYVQPGQRLLDIGIGTGLSAALFYKAGLLVSGLDSSPEMLKVCRAKGMTEDLRIVDIIQPAWPYPDRSFDHIIACGVFHFIEDLLPTLTEVGRIIRGSGIFGFTTRITPNLQDPERDDHKPSEETIDGMPIFSHSKGYLAPRLEVSGFTLLKEMSCTVGKHPEMPDGNFRLWITRKNG